VQGSLDHSDEAIRQAAAEALKKIKAAQEQDKAQEKKQ